MSIKYLKNEFKKKQNKKLKNGELNHEFLTYYFKSVSNENNINLVHFNIPEKKNWLKKNKIIYKSLNKKFIKMLLKSELFYFNLKNFLILKFDNFIDEKLKTIKNISSRGNWTKEEFMDAKIFFIKLFFKSN